MIPALPLQGFISNNQPPPVLLAPANMQAAALCTVQSFHVAFKGSLQRLTRDNHKCCMWPILQGAYCAKIFLSQKADDNSLRACFFDKPHKRQENVVIIGRQAFKAAFFFSLISNSSKKPSHGFA